jgi:hypothetical protein
MLTCGIMEKEWEVLLLGRSGVPSNADDKVIGGIELHSESVRRVGIYDISTGFVILILVLATGEGVGTPECKVWSTFLEIPLIRSSLWLRSSKRTCNHRKTNNEVHKWDHGDGDELKLLRPKFESCRAEKLSEEWEACYAFILPRIKFLRVSRRPGEWSPSNIDVSSVYARHYRLNSLIFTSIFNFPLSARRRKEELRTKAKIAQFTISKEKRNLGCSSFSTNRVYRVATVLNAVRQNHLSP